MNPTYLGYRAGSAVARLLPEPAVRPVSSVLGALGAAAMAPRRRVVERNLRRLHGRTGPWQEQQEVASTFGSYARYWLESFRLPGTSKEVLAAGFYTEGFEQVLAARDAGTGIILALPHLGGWEWAAFWLAEVQGLDVTAVVEPVEPPELADWFLGLRRSIGINAVPLGPTVATEVIRALRENHVLCLLCDRDLGGGGVEVEFFGERTTLPAGPATLALRTGAPLLPDRGLLRGWPPQGHGPPRAPGRAGRPVARRRRPHHPGPGRELEVLIRDAPDQWHLMQPNWPSDLPGGAPTPPSA